MWLAIFGDVESESSMPDLHPPAPHMPTLISRLLWLMHSLVLLASAAVQAAPEVGLPSVSLDSAWTASAAPSSDVPLPRKQGKTRITIGAGDVLAVTVFGHPDLSAEVTVTETQQVSLPLIGLLGVGNHTQGEVEQLISQRLRDGQFLLNPKVSVQVGQVRSQMVSVLGEILRPGRYPIQGRMTVFDLLATAGGLTPRAEQMVYVIRRQHDSTDETQRIQIPMRRDGMSDPSFADMNLIVQKDDMIFVDLQKSFYIYGEVRRPGSYPMESNLNLMRALSIGGGLTDRGSSRRIQIQRERKNTTPQEFDATLTDKIESGDVIFVKERLF